MRYIILLLLLVSCREYPTAQVILTKEGYTDITFSLIPSQPAKSDGKTHHSQHFKE